MGEDGVICEFGFCVDEGVECWVVDGWVFVVYVFMLVGCCEVESD